MLDIIRECNHMKEKNLFKREIKLSNKYDPNSDVVLFKGDVRKLLKTIPKETIQLIVTSPPYNIGKEYEAKTSLDEYFSEQKGIIKKCIKLLTQSGSICWQVGNYITSNSEVVPLDIKFYELFKREGMILRNRIIWYFGHGLHCNRRFSGRYETILWFTSLTLVD